ncbi:MAG: glycosyltransferase family 4 protein [Planctomycetes bacterium]|nr:glycosyltransferase family 4 protein [Planctomycetota bacterium]
MPAMTEVLHVIDRHVSYDMLDQLEQLAWPDDRIVSVGRPRRYPGFGRSAGEIHAPMGLALLAGRRLAKLAEGKSVIHVWSTGALPAAMSVANNIGLRIVLSLPCAGAAPRTRQIINWAGQGRIALTVPTAPAADRLIQAGFKASAVHVIPPPAPIPSDFHARREPARQASGLAGFPCLLAATSEMVRDAGHKYASWAHAIAQHMHGRFGLIFPGDGPHESHVRFFAATTGFDDAVRFTGWRMERLDVMAAADIALFFATKDTGVSALAAAMACGLPIAGAATPDICWLAPHEKAAILVSPGVPRLATVAVLRLFENETLRRDLGQAARARAAELCDPDKCRAMLKDIHNRLGNG